MLRDKFKKIFEGRKDLVKKTYEVEATPNIIEKLDKIIYAMDKMGCGMSRQFKVSFDGDGSDYLKCSSELTELSKEESESLDHDKLSI